VNQLVAEIRPDDRPLTSGGTVGDRDPHARRIRLWQYDEGREKPALIGELFLPLDTVEKMISAKSLLGLVAHYAEMELGWAGEVPEIAEHPRIPKAVKILRGLSKMFT